MVAALIFAGGTGTRMNTRSTPKQFLVIHGKPVIIYTLEHFEQHEEIDQIIVVCIREYIGELKRQLQRYGITKVTQVVEGGKTGHDSIFAGLQALQGIAAEEDIILIHDGVRPLINEALITANIEAVRIHGNAITCEAARETVVRSEDGRSICEVPDRDEMYVAKAPQSFRYGRICALYQKARENNHKSIDSAHLCHMYAEPMYIVKSPRNNIKITDPADFYICKAIYDAMENQQVFGI